MATENVHGDKNDDPVAGAARTDVSGHRALRVPDR